jgi:TRAP-type C4-dicarboxylate transport system permease small subunit
MALGSTTCRRLTGGLLLGAALVLLVLGETLFKGRLQPVTWLAYWTLCLLLTAGSMLVAFAEVRAVSRRTRREQHELFESTIKEIELDARERRSRVGKNGKRTSGA